MNDDPAMIDVLYAKVHMKDGSNRYVFITFSVDIFIAFLIFRHKIASELAKDVTLENAGFDHFLLENRLLGP